MRVLILLVFVLIVSGGCVKKNNVQGAGISFYLLSSYSTKIDSSVKPWALSITDAVLAEKPFIANQDIAYYVKADFSYTLRHNIKPEIGHYAGDKAFAVTLDGKPVYYGRFHPAYYSSIVVGLATIDPVYQVTENALRVNFISGTAMVEHPKDKRNDAALIACLSATGRLK